MNKISDNEAQIIFDYSRPVISFLSNVMADEVRVTINKQGQNVRFCIYSNPHPDYEKTYSTVKGDAK